MPSHKQNEHSLSKGKGANSKKKYTFFSFHSFFFTLYTLHKGKEATKGRIALEKSSSRMNRVNMEQTLCLFAIRKVCEKARPVVQHFLSASFKIFALQPLCVPYFSRRSSPLSFPSFSLLSPARVSSPLCLPLSF